ncbi:hypothetical protein EB795_07490 [Pseudomonas mandelii]|nr:hypothetical protein [Pseudomonas mandelii]
MLVSLSEIGLGSAGVRISTVGVRLLAMAAFGPTMLWLTGYISVSAVTAAGGFALTASPFCQTPQKEPKSLAPSVRPLAVRLRRTALRATPRMNTSTQPPERGGWIKIKS